MDRRLKCSYTKTLRNVRSVLCTTRHTSTRLDVVTKLYARSALYRSKGPTRILLSTSTTILPTRHLHHPQSMNQNLWYLNQQHAPIANKPNSVFYMSHPHSEEVLHMPIPVGLVAFLQPCRLPPLSIQRIAQPHSHLTPTRDELRRYLPMHQQ